MDCRDRTAVHRLYERTGRIALLKTASLVGRLDVAEEIVQGAFVKLWEAGLVFPDERAAYAWIYRTCHNAGIDHLRAHATKYERAVFDEQLDPTPAADPGYEAVAERQWLCAQLARLDAREAQVLAYRVLDGMLQREIAEVMGLSRKTVIRICVAIDAKLGTREAAADDAQEALA